MEFDTPSVYLCRHERCPRATTSSSRGPGQRGFTTPRRLEPFRNRRQARLGYVGPIGIFREPKKCEAQLGARRFCDPDVELRQQHFSQIERESPCPRTPRRGTAHAIQDGTETEAAGHRRDGRTASLPAREIGPWSRRLRGRRFRRSPRRRARTTEDGGCRDPRRRAIRHRRWRRPSRQGSPLRAGQRRRRLACRAGRDRSPDRRTRSSGRQF